jgi:hypothetical protein
MSREGASSLAGERGFDAFRQTRQQAGEHFIQFRWAEAFGPARR